MDYNDNQKIVFELWREHEAYIRKLCTYKLKSLPDCIDDCIQEIFLDLSNTLNKGKTIEYPRAWLAKVANNKIKDIYTQANKENEKLIPFESQNIDNTYSGIVYDEHFPVSDDEILVLKDKVIDMLDDKEKQLLCDKYVLKKNTNQIAKEYKTTENNIYQKLFRLKQKTKMLVVKVLNE